MALYQDTVVVGARGDDSSRGSAHVFVLTGNEWTHQAKLLAPNRRAADWFGWSVAIFEGTVVVGANEDDDYGYATGSAYVFRCSNGNECIHRAKLLAPDGTVLDYFGWSVLVYQDTVIVGSMWDDDNCDDSGSAYVFAPPE